MYQKFCRWCERYFGEDSDEFRADECSECIECLLCDFSARSLDAVTGHARDVHGIAEPRGGEHFQMCWLSHEGE